MTKVRTETATAEQVIELARQGRLSKQELAPYLGPAARKTFLRRCTQIEKRYTEACTATGDPCLASGCALEGQGEICLQPLENAGVDYDRACGNAFVELFVDPLNRQ